MTEILYMPDIESNYIEEFEAQVMVSGDDHIVLDKTVFYPEGGGQPSDTGTVEWNDKKSEVTKVEKKGKIIHRIDGEIPDEGAKVHGKIDWDKRFKHMKLHTAQHLFSAAVFEMYGGETVGNQIYTDYSRVDFEPVKFTDEDIDIIEDEVNRVIKQGRPVRIYEEERNVLEDQLEEGRVNLSLLPKSIKKLRIIDIDGYDICPCAGTHVRNTGEIGEIEISKVENKGKNRERIYYKLK